MISFIIPTIHKSIRLIKLVQDLENCDLVSEILIIEDAPSIGMLDGLNLNKTKIIPFTERRYCNGGWNHGVKLVKNYYYALCSDDCNFDTDIIRDVLHFYKLRPNSGFIGMDPSQYDTQHPSNFYGVQRKFDTTAVGGWGVMMFNHKNNDVIIPDDLKQWCGDSYYLTYSKYPNYSYFGPKIYTEMSTSTHQNENFSSPEIEQICIQDQITFEEKYKK